MAKFKVTSTSTVAELKEQFRKEFGGVLRVYEGRSEASDSAKLVSLGAKEGEFECRACRTVGSFEEDFKKEFNLKVKVYTKDNRVAVLDGIILASVNDIPKNATKVSMEEFIGYKSKDVAIPKELLNRPLVYIKMEKIKEEVPDGFDNMYDYVDHNFSYPCAGAATIDDDLTTVLVSDMDPGDNYEALKNQATELIKREYLDDDLPIPVEYSQSTIIEGYGFDIVEDIESIGAGLNAFFGVEKPIWYFLKDDLDGLIFCLDFGYHYDIFEFYSDNTMNLLDIDRAQFDKLVELYSEDQK